MSFRFKRRNIVTILFIVLLPLMVLNISCSGRRDTKPQPIRLVYKPDTLSFLIKFESSLFPLPSPYQVAHLLKNNGVPFNESIISKTEHAKQYTTTFKQALNLGVFGTDLSYLNIYDRTPQSVAYLGVIKKLAEELGLIAVFDEKFFTGVERNMNCKDSLLTLLSRSYSKADSYLRESDRTDMGALILAGGWTESIFILSKIAKSTSNRELINRLGEQKHPLDNLIEVLTPLYYKSPEHAELIDKYIDLAYEFDDIIYSYSYKEPKIDEQNKVIYINSQSRVIISEYHLDVISQKIEEIRKLITG